MPANLQKLQYAAMVISSTTQVVVAAVTANKISPVFISLNASTTAIAGILWMSGSTTGASLSQAISVPLGGAYPGNGYCPVGHFETVSGEALIGAVSAGMLRGYMVYTEVTT